MSFRLTLSDSTAARSDIHVQDTAIQSDATVGVTPRRVGPPDTTYHMKLGYIVAGVIFGLYIVVLLRRVATVRRGS